MTSLGDDNAASVFPHVPSDVLSDEILERWRVSFSPFDPPTPHHHPKLLFPPLDCPALLAPSKSAAADPDFLNEPNTTFDAVCASPDFTLNPVELGFIPTESWKDERVTFGTVVKNFFNRKTGGMCRFTHKLFNALRIVQGGAVSSQFVGVKWVNDAIIKVDKIAFARLLGIKVVEGSLFHRQGNFPSHGFIELLPTDARLVLPDEELKDVDFDRVRLVTHTAGEFVRGTRPNVEARCKWINSRKSE
jgi:hypothetical protein